MNVLSAYMELLNKAFLKEGRLFRIKVLAGQISLLNFVIYKYVFLFLLLFHNLPPICLNYIMRKLFYQY